MSLVTHAVNAVALVLQEQCDGYWLSNEVHGQIEEICIGLEAPAHFKWDSNTAVFEHPEEQWVFEQAHQVLLVRQVRQEIKALRVEIRKLQEVEGLTLLDLSAEIQEVTLGEE